MGHRYFFLQRLSPLKKATGVPKCPMSGSFMDPAMRHFWNGMARIMLSLLPLRLHARDAVVANQVKEIRRPLKGEEGGEQMNFTMSPSNCTSLSLPSLPHTPRITECVGSIQKVKLAVSKSIFKRRIPDASFSHLRYNGGFPVYWLPDYPHDGSD